MIVGWGIAEWLGMTDEVFNQNAVMIILFLISLPRKKYDDDKLIILYSH